MKIVVNWEKLKKTKRRRSITAILDANMLTVTKDCKSRSEIKLRASQMVADRHTLRHTILSLGQWQRLNGVREGDRKTKIIIKLLNWFKVTKVSARAARRPALISAGRPALRPSRCVPRINRGDRNFREKLIARQINGAGSSRHRACLVEWRFSSGDVPYRQLSQLRRLT